MYKSGCVFIDRNIHTLAYLRFNHTSCVIRSYQFKKLFFLSWHYFNERLLSVLHVGGIYFHRL